MTELLEQIDSGNDGDVEDNHFALLASDIETQTGNPPESVAQSSSDDDNRSVIRAAAQYLSREIRMRSDGSVSEDGRERERVEIVGVLQGESSNSTADGVGKPASGDIGVGLAIARERENVPVVFTQCFIEPDRPRSLSRAGEGEDESDDEGDVPLTTIGNRIVMAEILLAGDERTRVESWVYVQGYQFSNGSFEDPFELVSYRRKKKSDEDQYNNKMPPIVSLDSEDESDFQGDRKRPSPESEDADDEKGSTGRSDSCASFDSLINW
ncbi:hypothetical protein RUND412_004753 [Rhizina undulata]